MRVERVGERVIGSGPQGVATDGYEGGCMHCGKYSGSRWDRLPSIISSRELYLTGVMLCDSCESVLSTNAPTRVKFAEKLLNEAE